MNLVELVQKRQNVNCDIIDCIKDQITNIKLSAENMIECATNIKGQGYSLFMQSREDFLEKIDSLKEQIDVSADINSCTHH